MALCWDAMFIFEQRYGSFLIFGLILNTLALKWKVHTKNSFAHQLKYSPLFCFKSFDL